MKNAHKFDTYASLLNFCPSDSSNVCLFYMTCFTREDCILATAFIKLYIIAPSIINSLQVDPLQELFNTTVFIKNLWITSPAEIIEDFVYPVNQWTRLPVIAKTMSAIWKFFLHRKPWIQVITITLCSKSYDYLCKLLIKITAKNKFCPTALGVDLRARQMNVCIVMSIFSWTTCPRQSHSLPDVWYLIETSVESVGICEWAF